MPDIIRIEKVNLVDAVYTQLRDLLVSGKWSEGTKFPSENELCREFSVSRVVIREALQKLRGERLIVTRQGIGTYVANPSNFEPGEHEFVLSERTYREFLDFREAVEFSAIRLLKQSAMEEDFLRMEQNVLAMEAAADSDAYDLADFGFHLSLVSASHNEMLIRAMTANKNTVICVFHAMNTLPDARSFGASSHREIVDLLRQKRTREVITRFTEMGKYNLTRLNHFFQNS
jgi:DNA-binding FadR family transcriptional regulator